MLSTGVHDRPHPFAAFILKRTKRTCEACVTACGAACFESTDLPRARQKQPPNVR